MEDDKMIVTANFDDFHPQSKPYDFGGIDGKVLDKLIELNTKFGLKLTLFTVPNWQDRPHNNLTRVLRRCGFKYKLGNEPFRLDKHKDWCDVVRRGVEKEIWEIAVHGYTHFNDKKGLHQQEFVDLNHRQAVDRIEKAMNVFDDAKIPFVKIFRPAGWGFNKHTLSALESCGFKAIAPFPSWYKITSCMMDDLKVIPNAGNDELHLKYHLCWDYGSEVIENGIENNFVYDDLINRVSGLKAYTPKFLSEVI